MHSLRNAVAKLKKRIGMNEKDGDKIEGEY